MGGKTLPPLTLREVIAILTQNGFERISTRGSHARYKGAIKGEVRTCTVDLAIDDWSPKSHHVLYYLVKRELKISLKDFYAGNKDTAARAKVDYKPFGGIDN